MLIKDIPRIMVICLVMTILIEVSFAWILKVKNKKDFVNIILVNVITNPIVVIIPIFLDYHYGLDARNISLIILEILTVIVEGYIYKKTLSYKKINPYFLSLILNILSYFIGDIFWRLV